MTRGRVTASPRRCRRRARSPSFAAPEFAAPDAMCRQHNHERARGAPRLRRGAPNAGGLGGPVEAPHVVVGRLGMPERTAAAPRVEAPARTTGEGPG